MKTCLLFGFLATLVGCSSLQKQGLTKEQVESTLQGLRPQLRDCRKKHYHSENGDEVVRVAFDIQSNGQVSNARLDRSESSLRNWVRHNAKEKELEECVLNTIKGSRFPVPNGASAVQVTYPFEFKANP